MAKILLILRHKGNWFYPENDSAHLVTKLMRVVAIGAKSVPLLKQLGFKLEIKT